MTTVATGLAARLGLRTASLAVVAALAVLYAPVLRDLAATWERVSYHTYGFFIAPFAIWLAWEARAEVRRAPLVPWRPGLAIVAAGLGLLAAGMLAPDIPIDSLVLRSLSLPVVLAGWGLFALGVEGFRPLVFPVGFLAFMTPLPAPALAALSLPLQTIAAVFTTAALNAVGIAALRDGLFITLPAVTLHVSEDCNGLRFLLAMAVLGVAFGALTQRTLRVRLIVVALAITIGIVANQFRVFGTGVVAHVWGRSAATGTPHLVYGKAVYLVMLIPFVLAVMRLRDGGPRHGPPYPPTLVAPGKAARSSTKRLSP